VEHIWKHPNLKYWQNENELCAHVVNKARHVMDEWMAANSRNTTTHTHNVSGHSTGNSKHGGNVQM